MKARSRFISVVLILVLVVSLAGCATLEENKGAAIGSGLGAAAGVLLGGSTSGRIVGGLVGALVGGAIGHYAFDKKRTAEQTATSYNYQASQGSMLTIEDASVAPGVVNAGGTVEIRLTYAVLNPSANTETSLREIREITHEGQPVGKTEVTAIRTSGTYTSTIPIRLPGNTNPGIYDVTAVIQSQDSRDVRYASFSVQ